MKNKVTLVVDESVSPEQCRKALKYLKMSEEEFADVLRIREKYPTMPDAEIMRHLLNENTLLVTADRVLHNKVLARKQRSVYIGERGMITSRELKGVQIKPERTRVPKTELQTNYSKGLSDIHTAIVPRGELHLKKLKTRRRRIANYFDGLHNVANVNVGLSVKRSGAAMLVGFTLRVSSSNGIAALDASGSFIEEKHCTDDSAYFCHVLITLLRLALTQKEVTIYYDSMAIKSTPKATDVFFDLYEILAARFAQLTLTAVQKGDKIVKLRQKLQQLHTNDAGRELMPSDIEDINERVQSYDPNAVYIPED